MSLFGNSISEMQATAIHEAAHAVVSHALGVRFDYVVVNSAREGVMMPFYSPCPLCGHTVPEFQSCEPCFEHYGRHRPTHDPRSAAVERFYREEAAIAVAGELAELNLSGGHILSTTEEIEWDRARVLTRASLRHLWLAGTTCVNYCSAPVPCEYCDRASAELSASVARWLSDQLWPGVLITANLLEGGERRTGAEVGDALAGANISFAHCSIDAIWPALTQP